MAPQSEVRERKGSLRTRALSAGLSTTCALREDREIQCWGAGVRTEQEPPPGPFESFSWGGEHGCGLDARGRASCWGETLEDDLDLTLSDLRFAQISVADGHGCGVTLDHEVHCWGSAGPWWRVAVDDDYVAVESGNARSCALRSGGQVVCWEAYGNESDPYLALPAEPLTSLVSGDYHACGLRGSGEALCWGSNEHGQLDAPDERFSQLAAGYGFTCGLRTDGGVDCWGERAAADGRRQIFVPMESPSGGDFVSVAAGAFHACAIDSASEVTCWGDNAYGQILVP